MMLKTGDFTTPRGALLTKEALRMNESPTSREDAYNLVCRIMEESQTSEMWQMVLPLRAARLLIVYLNDAAMMRIVDEMIKLAVFSETIHRVQNAKVGKC